MFTDAVRVPVGKSRDTGAAISGGAPRGFHRRAGALPRIPETGGDAMRRLPQADGPFFAGGPGLFTYVGGARQAPMMS